MCVSCGVRRGYIYVGPVYGENDLADSLCPWCIADGSAAAKFSASFADDHALLKAGVPRNVVEEVHLRTPAFSSWQQAEWLTHCNDACEFHGDASREDLILVESECKGRLLARFRMSEAGWSNLLHDYAPKGDPSVYKFVCRHCKAVLLGMDFS